LDDYRRSGSINFNGRAENDGNDGGEGEGKIAHVAPLHDAGHTSLGTGLPLQIGNDLFQRRLLTQIGEGFFFGEFEVLVRQMGVECLQIVIAFPLGSRQFVSQFLILGSKIIAPFFEVD
jgi:hypothetical protein